jgi:transposase
MASDIQIIHPHSAGIDIGAEKVFVFVPGHEVQNFDTFTSSFHTLVEFFKKAGVETVAMEATGVYWYSLHELLEAAGIEVYLVNGAHVKNVPGRKSDVSDCQWLQQLHQYGLLRRSFIPAENTRQLRSYVRLRDDHIEMRAAHIGHIQKALTSMNIRLHQVISQIMGASGMRIIKSILGGNLNAEALADLCEKQILNKKREQVVLSLQGVFKREHLFALRQAVECYEFYDRQILACDAEIEKLLQEINEHLPPPQDHPTLYQSKPTRHNAPKIENLHPMLVTMMGGKDLATISGLTDLSFLKLLSEIGTDISRWPTFKHFTAWLGLTPNRHQSGKTNKRRTNRAKTRAGQIFREAAQSLSVSKFLALGSFYRRICTRRGPKIANMATARKLAVWVYNLLKNGHQFVEQGVVEYNKRLKIKQEQLLMKMAKKLGFELTPQPTAHAVH